MSIASIASIASLMLLCAQPHARVVSTADEPRANETAAGAHRPRSHEEADSDVGESVDNLLRRLGLEQWYAKGLGQPQFLTVSLGEKVRSDRQVVPVRELVSQFMQMLKTADYKIRYLGHSKEQEEEEEEECTECNTENEGPVHPMDLLLCFFLCADDFLRQDMFERLSMAQLALPFVVPMPHSARLEIPLWSFRKVIKSVLSPTESGLMIHKELSVCNMEFPIVCFVRYGQSKLSKSRVANGVLNEGKHDVFFHRECENSVESRVLADGLAEIYWDYPNGKETKRLTAFVNLRGDAMAHSQQAAYLHDIAAVNVIFCTKADYEKMDTTVLQNLRKKPLIWVSPDMSPLKNEKENVIQCKRGSNASMLNKLRERIKEAASHSGFTCSLSSCAARGQQLHNIAVDNGDNECAEGRKHAEEIFEYLKRENPRNAKKKLLPRSNAMWNLWCKKDMESTQLKERSGRSIEEHRCEIEENKKRIRFNQAEKVKDKGFMNAFLGKLKIPSPKTRRYFLRWMEILFNEFSGETLAERRAKYIHFNEQLQVAEVKKYAWKERELKEKLDNVSQEINACTFGLEHCLREVAQMYEAVRAQGREDCNYLPRIAADLLRDGEPLELMDGDACYVPLDWVRAVLEELHTTLGGKKVFVLSVLGVQSSGKSTLLNTMFGLRFAVSAGRCTRGAFMRLMDVAEEDRGESGFDYILVVDTEGLRSQELSDDFLLKHDNKMATFVIGLANMTLINVYGEGSSDVKDFLQIAVHTFLRMHQVKHKPSCLFVHQNVSDPAAKEKNAEARHKATVQLDKMTAEAAKQEGLEVRRFDDVIQNSVQSNYFPALFFGDPPMAPLNPSYIAKANEVRNAILEDAKNQNTQGVMSILHLGTRVKDLWTALRGENFVFSFKNTLELRAHGRVETKRCELERAFRHGFVRVLETLRNSAKKGELTTVSDTEVKGDPEVCQLKQLIEKQCEEFFEKDEESNILKKWHEQTKIHLESFFGSLVDETVTQAKNYIHVKNCKKNVDQRVKEYEKKIIEKTKKLARENEGKVTPEEGDKLFSDMFESYLREIEKFTPKPHPVNVKSDAQNSLRARFCNEPHVTEKVIQMSETSKFTAHPSEHLKKYRGLIGWARCFLKNTRMEKAYIESTCDNLVEMVKNYFNIKKGNNYSKEYYEDIIEIVVSEVKRLNSMANDEGLHLHKDFSLDALVHIFGLSVSCFTHMYKEFGEKNHPVYLLKEKRDDLYQHFNTAYDGAVAMELFANEKSKKIMEGYKKTILNDVVQQIVDGITSEMPAFSGNKSKLEAHIQTDLVERECFADLIKYICKAKEYFRIYINRRVSDYCEEGCPSRLHQIIKNTVEHYHGLIGNCMKNSITEVKSAGGDANAWLDALYKQIKNNVSFSLGDLKGAVPKEKADCFQEGMLAAWNNFDRASHTESIYSKSRIKIMKLVIDDLMKEKCGCLETCPFCRAVCCNTLAGHTEDHCVVLHRPKAIGGWRYRRTEEASIDICSSSVSSDKRFYLNSSSETSIPFKQYRTAGPPYDKWSITPDNSFQELWKWIVCRFRNELADYFGYKFEGLGKIPSAWEKVTKNEALESMKDYL